VDNTLWPDDEAQPSATVAGDAVARGAPVGLPGSVDTCGDALDPTRFPVRTPRAGHGRPWFMDAVEAARGAMTSPGFASTIASSIAPARWLACLVRRIGPMALRARFQNVVADPNPNLTVQLFRQPLGEWVGIRAQTRWQPATGLESEAVHCSTCAGEIGRVSMSVVLVPFPKPAAAAN